MWYYSIAADFHTYHSLHIQDRCALVNVFLGCNGTSRELNSECPLKLSHMVLKIAIQSCDLQQLVRVNLTQPFYVNRLP